MIAKDGYNLPSKEERRLCLIVVDMQKCFFDRKDDDYHLAVSRMKTAIDSFMEKGRDVFLIKHVKNDGKEWDLGLVDELSEYKGPAVMKYHMDAFCNTNLSDVIRSKGYDSVLICGAYSEYCIIATYFGAFDHDLSPFLLEGATISYRKERMGSVEDICSIYSMEEMYENLSTATMDKDCGTAPSRMKRKYWYVN